MAQDRKEYMKKYQQEHKEKCKQASKKYRDNNKTKSYIQRIKSYFKSLNRDDRDQVINDLTILNNDLD